jgi:flagellar assembly factor FliW
MNAAADTVTIPNIEGALEVPSDAVMHFAEPLWGFPERHAYALLPTARAGIWWLMAASEPPLSFAVADPFVVDPNYAVDLGELERGQLQVTDETDVMALVMLALPASATETATGNFRAPLVFNLRTRQAMQVISRDEAHKMQQPVNLAAYPLTE